MWNNLRFFLLCLGLLYPRNVHSQMMKWLVRDTFGQAYMVDFSTPIPTVSTTVAGYGYAAGLGDNEDNNIMTDASNNVLFTYLVYLNNLIEVRDASYVIMPNGSGLLGNNSCQESALVRIPCSTDKYYIVHSTISPNDLYYSVVNMSLNSGNGDVSQKNILIGNNIAEGKTISHQLPTGCRWLIVAEIVTGTSYNILRYLISDSGIGSPTVIASVSLQQAVGIGPYELELSPDNTKLAMSTHRDNPTDADIFIWDFDLASGTLSNQVNWSVSSDQIHGIQWSPDNSKLYYVANAPTDAADFGRINLTTNAVELIDPMMGRYIGVCELAGNGRIYVSPNYNYNYLAEVANPNAATVAGIGYTHNAIFISSNGMRSSVPSAIEGELPGSTTTPQFIYFDGTGTGICGEYAFRDSSCLGTWWEWNFGDGSFSNSPSPVHQYLTPGTYDVTLRMVACGDTLVLSKPGYVQINSNFPVASFQTITASCAGDTATFLNQSIYADTYQWDFGDGSFSTDSVPVHVYSGSGNYTVQLIAIDASGGCRDTTVQVIQISNNVVSSFTVTTDSCNLTVSLFNTSQNASIYSWDFGDGSTGTGSPPLHLYSLPGNYNIQLIATNTSTGCSDTTVANIQIAPQVQALFTTTLDSCNFSVQFDNTSQNANAYSWNFGDGSSGSMTTPLHVYSGPGNYSIELIALNSTSGCSDTVVLALQIPNSVECLFTPTLDSCRLTVTLTNNSLNASSYSWNFGDSTYSTFQNPVHTFSSAGPYTVQLTAASASGCIDTSSLVVQFPIPPTAQFSYNSAPCSTLVNFTNQSSNYTSQVWMFGDGSGSSSMNPTHDFIASGTYNTSLVVANQTGCVDTLLQTIIVGARPVANFTISIDTCHRTVAFQNSSGNGTSYHWDFGDQTSSILTSPTHAYLNSGNYSVQLLAGTSIGCIDSIRRTFSLPELPFADFEFQNQSCDSIIHFLNASAFGTSYEWSFGDGSFSALSNPIHTFPASGSYVTQLTVQSAANCTDTVSKVIQIVKFIPADFDVSIDSCTGNLLLSNIPEQAISYHWVFNNTISSSSQQPIFTLPESGSYFLSLTVNANTPCKDSIIKTISFQDILGDQLYIPNSFTPNNDGINDVFKIFGWSYCDNYSLTIYNRWGESIFHTEYIFDDFWDGTSNKVRSPEGIYIYLLHGKNSFKSGSIFLTR